MVTVGVAGVAHIHAPGFLKKLRERGDIRVKALWDPDADRAERRGTEFGMPVVADADAIWSDAEIQGVIVCSETNRHEALVTAGARAGKHLFVEKPLGFGRDDAVRMAAAIRRAGVLFQTGYFRRSEGIMRYLREQVAAGAFGTVTRVRGSNCHAGALKGWFDTDWRWMADPKVAGCGGFGDLGTHLLDILMWFVGPVRKVAARLERGTARYGKCDEFGEALLLFKNGTLGTLAAGWNDVANPVSLEICGTQGHATIMQGKLYLQSEHIPGADGKEPWSQLPPNLPHAFDLFLDALGGKTDVTLVTPAEAADRSRVMGAVYEAARTGKWLAVR